MHIEVIGLSDHFLVFTILSSVRPRPVCETFEVRNAKSIGVEMFRSMLMESEVVTAPKSETKDFAAQLKDCTIGVLDKLAPVRCVTKRCGKPTIKWLSSEAITVRRARRGLEHRYRRTRIEETRRAFRAACRETNRLIRESRHAHYTKKLADTAGIARDR